MNDAATSILELRHLVSDFVNARDWGQFHTPKNLCMALSIEAAELMEHFQWLTPEQANAVAADANRLGQVGEELADVLCYAFALANALGLDVATAVRAKMIKNAQKYPVEAYRGRYGADDPGRADS